MSDLIKRLRHADTPGAKPSVLDVLTSEAADLIEQQAARIAELEAARIAYASEFEPDAEGLPDVGSIHANIRALKSKIEARAGEAVAWMLEWTHSGDERGQRLYDDERHCLLDAETDGGVCVPLGRINQAASRPPTGDAAGKDSVDAALLDWLDAANRPLKMGWRVAVAPAGNVSIGSVIQLGGKITSIREAISAAIASLTKTADGEPQ